MWPFVFLAPGLLGLLSVIMNLISGNSYSNVYNVLVFSSNVLLGMLLSLTKERALAKIV